LTTNCSLCIDMPSQYQELQIWLESTHLAETSFIWSGSSVASSNQLAIIIQTYELNQSAKRMIVQWTHHSYVSPLNHQVLHTLDVTTRLYAYQVTAPRVLCDMNSFHNGKYDYRCVRKNP
jgi:hypothetical protein